MYSKVAKLRFAYTELSEEVKATNARNQVYLQESSDKCIRGAVIKVDDGSKANAPGECEAHIIKCFCFTSGSAYWRFPEFLLKFFLSNI